MKVCDFVSVILLIVILQINSGHAQDQKLSKSESKRSSVAPIVEALEKKKQQLIQDELKQKKALQALYQLNSKLKKTVKQKSKIQSSINELQMNLDITNKNIQELESIIQKQKSTLSDRLRIIAKLHSSQIMGFLLSSSSSADLERNLKILGIIAEKDKKNISEFQINSRSHLIEKQKLSERLKVLSDKNAELIAQEKKFSKEQDLKKMLVNNLKKNHLFNLKQMSSLREQTREMNLDDSGLIDSILLPSFYEQKGNLAKPVDGNLVINYGVEKDPVHSIQIQNRGVHFSVPEGSAVRSVFDGEVSFSGNLPGFGLTVIVDHGDHFYTVYGNNKKVDVNEGHKIKRHQVIAHSGIDMKTVAPGIYFEVRHFSEPDDPQQWMKGLSK